ncbi:MAG: hypothetical protein KTR32_01545 [Granulosicoccus sp.]|nr:hypothetical protein [Granulosicoccus sp.]
MLQLLRQYFDIAFLMGKPQDLPGGDHQMKIGIGLALLTYIMALAVPYGLGQAFLQAVIDLLFTGAIFLIALILMGRRSRFEQAFGGFCGASAFINLAALPLFNLRPERVDTAGFTLTDLADLVLLVWGISLLAHVIKHTFEVNRVLSVVISFLYLMVLSSLMAAVVNRSQPSVSAHSNSHYVSVLLTTSQTEQLVSLV